MSTKYFLTLDEIEQFKYQSISIIWINRCMLSDSSLEISKSRKLISIYEKRSTNWITKNENAKRIPGL
jgi:hypothetical protein